MKDKVEKAPKGSGPLPAPPECCGLPMVINQRRVRVSGPRITYICKDCGGTKTVKE